MQPEQRDAGYLWDMLDAAQTVEQMSSNQDFTQYSNDRRTQLAVDGLATDFDVHFIDDWDEYHCYYGEIHCGTNVKRTPPAINWWE